MVCSYLINVANVTAEGNSVPTESSPRTTLERALHALEKGDAEAYAKCLSDDEIKFQAGYALYLNAVWEVVQNRSQNRVDPEMWLMSQNLQALIKKHNQIDYNANENRNHNFSIALNGFRHNLPVNKQGITVGENEQSNDNRLFRPYCISLSSRLKNPTAFVTEAIQILELPTKVIRQGKPIPSEEDSLKKMVENIQKKSWTFYERGEYAIAILPETKTTIAAPPNSSSSESLGQTATIHKETSIEFVQEEGEWKINRLFPRDILEITLNIY
ncbi:MAG TPA: hypothetical protein DIW81_10650 [Planctomycetaceae bacterium]|nr:hypothetical protein [Planctomycetaceae bacterium]